jgi:hypothetical protein
MSAVPSLAPESETGSRRNLPRYLISVPLDLITLRSGIPDSIPGRCTDISEAGLGAAFAGELKLNQHVAIELKLPQLALPLRARAIVRHHDRLHCGLQFVNLSIEQREMIRFWAHRNPSPPAEEASPATAVPEPLVLKATAVVSTGKPNRRIGVRKRSLLVLLLFVLGLAALGWWYWQSAWSELEHPASFSEAARPAGKLS